MEIRVCSINEAKSRLQKIDTSNVLLIMMSSYRIDPILNNSGKCLVLNFDDITDNDSEMSFSIQHAKMISSFLDKYDLSKYIIYICCDCGVSRSSAVGAAILRKNGENEYAIWSDASFSPNILVYKILCNEFGLHNSWLGLHIRKTINCFALRRAINSSRKKNEGVL